MCEKLTDSSKLSEKEKALLPYMTNELYDQKYSVITEYFPITSTVGRRLVDAKLLKRQEYEELSGLPPMVGYRPEHAGPALVKFLRKSGSDSMCRFYKVLLEDRDRDRDVDTVLKHLEEAAQRRRDVS